MTEEFLDIQTLKYEKRDGLIPVVVQDFKSRKVLMMAYTNLEALGLTLNTGYAHYWSRSRGKLWKKGETSGSVQKIKEILVDCDSDALLFVVEQKGNVCHKGRETCFHNKLRETKGLEDV
jgi:phosphoribosyl-AMP cyclohydrolase